MTEDGSQVSSAIDSIEATDSSEEVKMLVPNRFFYQMHHFCVKRSPVMLSRLGLTERAKQGRIRAGRYIAILGREAIHVFDNDAQKFIFADR